MLPAVNIFYFILEFKCNADLLIENSDQCGIKSQRSFWINLPIELLQNIVFFLNDREKLKLIFSCKILMLKIYYYVRFSRLVDLSDILERRSIFTLSNYTMIKLTGQSLKMIKSNVPKTVTQFQKKLYQITPQQRKKATFFSRNRKNKNKQIIIYHDRILPISLKFVLITRYRGDIKCDLRGLQNLEKVQIGDDFGNDLWPKYETGICLGNKNNAFPQSVTNVVYNQNSYVNKKVFGNNITHFTIMTSVLHLDLVPASVTDLTLNENGEQRDFFLKFFAQLPNLSVLRLLKRKSLFLHDVPSSVTSLYLSKEVGFGIEFKSNTNLKKKQNVIIYKPIKCSRIVRTVKNLYIESPEYYLCNCTAENRHIFNVFFQNK